MLLLVDDRRSASLNKEACGQKGAPCVGGSSTTIQQLMSAPPILSAHQKYATALAVEKDLASLAAEVGTAVFNERLDTSEYFRLRVRVMIRIVQWADDTHIDRVQALLSISHPVQDGHAHRSCPSVTEHLPLSGR